MKLYIKYMVCIRCEMLLKLELNTLGIHYSKLELGEVDTKGLLAAEQLKQLKTALLKSGLELIDDKKTIVIEKIKNIIIEMIRCSAKPTKTNFSDYLSKKLNCDFTYLSNLFLEIKGTTIEHYIIAHKVERAKELLLYNELTFAQIAQELNYSSVAHLSNQFKIVTGLSPLQFKKLKQYNTRITLEDV